MARPQNIIGEAVSIKFPNLLLESKGPKNNDFKENPGSLLMIYIIQTLIIMPINMAITALIRLKYFKRNFSTLIPLLFYSEHIWAKILLSYVFNVIKSCYYFTIIDYYYSSG